MTAELTKALCAFHRDVSTIHKEAHAQYGKYADLAAVLSTVLPALSKNGLAVVQTFEPCADGEQVLVTALLHTSGERIESRLPLVVPKGRNPLHDWGGATTYSRRYALLAILSLSAGIEDDDGDHATQAAPAAAKAVSASEDQEKPSAKRLNSVNPERLSQQEKDELVNAVVALPQGRREEVVAAFKARFAIPEKGKAADYVKTAIHRDFLLKELNAVSSK
jgi:hypothetical protein